MVVKTKKRKTRKKMKKRKVKMKTKKRKTLKKNDKKDDDEDEALNRLSYPTFVGIQYWQKIVLIRNQYILHTYLRT